MNQNEFVTQRIVQLQTEKRYSQQFMANELGIHRTSYNKKHQGLTKFKMEEVLKCAELFEVEIGSITDPNYKQNQESALGVKEPTTEYIHAHDPQPKQQTITISIEVPISGGLNIPEDINDQILKLITKNQ